LNLLIVSDLSKSSPVVKAAVARPWPPGSAACILHVVDLEPFPSGASILEMAKQSAQATLKSMAEELKQSGLKVQTEVLSGYPKTAIPKYAENWGADLVMVGSHGAGGMARFLLGSVAQAVVRSSPCSVEIVRPAREPLAGRAGMKILLATDGSASATAAVRSVGSRPWPPKTSIRLVSVVGQLMPYPDGRASYFNEERLMRMALEAEEEGRSRAGEVIAKARAVLGKLGIEHVEAAAVVSGDPKTVILDEASEWKADLIALGSHGWHGVDRLIMGSVSESVAMHAHCSVEVIR